MAVSYILKLQMNIYFIGKVSIYSFLQMLYDFLLILYWQVEEYDFFAGGLACFTINTYLCSVLVK